MMHDGAPLHHVALTCSSGADVVERVAGYGDQVGELAGLDRANPVGHAEQFGGVGGGRAEDLGWGHAGRDVGAEHRETRLAARLPRRLERRCRTRWRSGLPA